MNIASIDIGTNTILLLIAEYDPKIKKIKTLKNEYRMPRIGKGLTSGEQISETSINKMLEVLTEYKILIEKYSCDKVLVTGTNALRIASNSREIISSILEEFNFDLRVISGKEEANYAFLGSTEGVNTDLPNLVIDIGGGSTELILGKKNEITYSQSFPFGAVSLTERFIQNEKPLKDSISMMKEFIRSEIEKAEMKLSGEFLTVAVAGTPTSLSCIKQNLKIYDVKKVEHSKLDFEFLENIIDDFSQKTPTQILSDYGSVLDGREDIILAGTIILAEICKTFKIRNVLVSSKGIRYGALVNYIKNEFQKGK